MKIQEASEDVTKEGIMFPNSKTSYMEANTKKDDEIGITGPKHQLHALGARHMLRRLVI